jgi:hypothetical protein
VRAFLGSMAIEEEVKKEERYIMALSEDGCLQQLNLKCSIDKKIKDIMSTMTSFGESSVVVATVHQYHCIIRTNDASCYIDAILTFQNIKCIM